MAEKNPFLYGLLKSSKDVFKLTKQRISIGRNKNSQIVINNNTVSKDHAIIEFDEDYNATIKDLNSSNGTYVNGEKLKTIPLKLRTGDKIKFGKYEIEFTFESSNVLNDTKTEGELMKMDKMDLNENSFGVNNNQIYDSIEVNQNNQNIKDGKISLVNENEISYPKINHFKNKQNNLNDFRPNKSNGIIYKNNSEGRIKNLLNNNLNNQYKQIYIQDNNNNLNNNMMNKNNTINNNNFLNYNENEENENYNMNNMNNLNNINNMNNEIDNNILMNSDYTFKNRVDELERKIEILQNEKEDLNKALNDKINELKQMTNLFDELNEEYSKLNSKHNALMVYASDIQKKLDLSNIQINELQNKNIISNENDFNKIINQKDNMILILQKEINFYKELCNRNNQTFNIPMNNNNLFDNNNILLNNKINTISDIFINENKKLKKKLEIYKNKINTIQKNNTIINKKGTDINFAEFEIQINYQIDNFNNIISEYNSKLFEALNKITELFENNNKEEAAKYLVEQINEYMLENQKLISENAKLNTQIFELQSLLNKEHESNLLFNKNKNTISDIDIENKSLNISSNSEINILKNKVGQLENIIENIKSNKNNNTHGVGGDNNLREAFVNVLNELKNKENTIKGLQNQLKDTINRNNMNFDDKEIVSSISEKLKEKDNMIQNLKYKIKNDEISENEGRNQKIEDIRKKRELFN